jgi:hypothetical protein
MSRNVLRTRICLNLGIVAVLVLGLAVQGYAQGAGTAEIRGTITDPTGAVVPDASAILATSG